MIIECTECASRYLVPDEAIGAEGRTVRCANCRHSWYQPPAVAQLMEAARERHAEAAARLAAVGAAPAPARGLSTGPVPATYADEPMPADAAPAPRRPRRNPAQTWTIVAIAAAAAMLAALAAILWSGQPGFAAWLGLAQQSAGSPLQFADKAIDRRELPNGSELFAVSGKVVNPTDARQRVPDIRADLRDAQGRRIYSWTITPERRFVGPRGQQAFNSAKLDVPGNGRVLELSFTGDAAD